jgi:hypothetical protein
MDHSNSSKTLEDNDGTIDGLVIEKLEGWRSNNSIGKKTNVSKVSFKIIITTSLEH